MPRSLGISRVSLHRIAVAKGRRFRKKKGLVQGILGEPSRLSHEATGGGHTPRKKDCKESAVMLSMIKIG